MKVYSSFKEWVKCRNAVDNSLKYYVLCEKKLFRKPRILGTNIKVKPKCMIEDITLKRYGIEETNFHTILWRQSCYSHESNIACFTSTSFIPEIVQNIRTYRHGIFDIKYMMHHLILAKVRIPDYADVIPGFLTIAQQYRCVLTKQVYIDELKRV